MHWQAQYWLGTGWIEAVVEKYASQNRRASLKNATEGVDTFVSGAEMVSFPFFFFLYLFCRGVYQTVIVLVYL